jgi:hypothetical protein
MSFRGVAFSVSINYQAKEEMPTFQPVSPTLQKDKTLLYNETNLLTDLWKTDGGTIGKEISPTPNRFSLYKNGAVRISLLLLSKTLFLSSVITNLDY